MKVAVDKINDSRLLVQEDIVATAWEVDNVDMHFIDPIHLECAFSKVGKEIIVDTEMATQVIVTCSRCLEEVKQSVRRRFQSTYDADELGEYLEIDDDIREEFLLTFPMKVLCVQECKGLCPVCGINLNRATCTCQQEEKPEIKSEHKL